MKCLSIKQPYAELIVSGKKTIELRTWNTKFRGEFLVRASKRVYEEDCKRLNIDSDRVVTGGVIGRASLYDVKHYTSREEFLADSHLHLASERYYPDHAYGFMLKNSSRLSKPVIIKGRLGFYNVEIQT
jgi:ASC-1-like (ASCH) protein